MRLPTQGQGGPIDEEKARKSSSTPIAMGSIISIPPTGTTEGRRNPLWAGCFPSFPRDTWYLASKMPGHMMNYQNGRLGFQGYLAGEKIGPWRKFSEEQLGKCGVDYFDFYLLHNVL